MYVKKDLLFQIITLFKEQPIFRDDCWLTLEYIVNKYYRDKFGENILVTAKLLFDIDRGFRYTQDKFPQLRGKEWLKRQWMGGELSAADYKDLNDITDQLELDFE